MLSLAAPPLHRAHYHRSVYHHSEDLMSLENPPLSDHFTQADRRELIQTGERLAGLKEDFQELKRSIERGNNDQSIETRNIKQELQLDIRRIEVDLKQKCKDLDERSRVLENFRYWMLGAAAGAGALGGWIGARFHP